MREHESPKEHEMRQRKIGVRAGELELYPVGSGEVFETEEFSDQLCSKGPHPSTARQPSQGAECRALGNQRPPGISGSRFGPDAERRSEPRTSTADGTGFSSFVVSIPGPRRRPRAPCSLLGAQGLCGCQGGRSPAAPCGVKSRCSRPRGHD